LNPNTSSGIGHAFLFSPTGGINNQGVLNGTVTDLGTLGGTISIGNAINGSGIVTGEASTINDAAGHAFLYDGTMHDLGTLGGTNSDGTGINGSGQIVGYSDTTGDAAHHAFLYDAVHGMVDLNTLINPTSGWVLNQANAINASGQITGVGTLNGVSEGFLISPISNVPEPSTWALMAAGAAALLVFRRRR
jgi:probable HAF family extracellular repeat protein